jgi:dTDP-4-amino-4,6-dideoxygalactose transaminase
MIPITRPELPALEEYVALLEQIWSSRMLSNFSRFAKELEQLTREYLGVDTRVVTSGDIGLVLTVAALRLPAGSRALVPSFTFNSTINALLWNGVRPVFVDIDPETLNMDPLAARDAANKHAPSVIVATHVFGNPADADALGSIATSCGARLVFDAAHGYGARRGSAMVGSLGDAEVFSLSGTKPVTSGEGGLISSHDGALLADVELRRGYGFKGDYNSRVQGLNGKMSELHAALGLLTMRRIEAALAARHELVLRYRQGLAPISGLGYQLVRDADRSTFKDFAVLFPETGLRDTVEQALTANEIQTKRYFRPCHLMDAFSEYADAPLPVTEDTYARILCLPLFESLSVDAIDHICEIVSGVVRGG